MEVFWARGYEATTMTDLRKAMGIGRQSLYDTFGDKDELFAEALGRYISFNEQGVENLLAFDDPMEGLRDYLLRRVDNLGKGDRNGCLIMNSCVEIAPHNPEASSRLEATLKNMECAMQTMIERAIEKKQIKTNAKPRELALFMLSQIGGMVVLSKAGATREELQAVADRTLSALHSSS